MKKLFLLIAICFSFITITGCTLIGGSVSDSPTNSTGGNNSTTETTPVMPSNSDIVEPTDNPTANPTDSPTPTKNEELNIDSLEDSQYGVVGNFNGWGNDYVMKKYSDTLYVTKMDFAKNDEFKIRANKDWKENYGADGAGGANIKVSSSGTYWIVLNTETKTIHLTTLAEGPNLGEIVNPPIQIPEDGFVVNFNISGDASILIYTDKSLTNYVEKTLIHAYNFSTGKPECDGNDGVIFKVAVADGMLLNHINVSNEKAKLELKDGIYYLTNITSDLNVTVNIIKASEPLKPISPIGNIATKKDYFDEVQTLQYYSDLFDLSNKIEINIDVDASELKKLSDENDNKKNDIYHYAKSVTITINYKDGRILSKTIRDVGIKMKGNTSRGKFYDSEGFYANRHFKLSFNETFDDNAIYSGSSLKVWNDLNAKNDRENRTFFGLSSLEMKGNRENDYTFSRDIYISKAYRQNGIYAQNTTAGILNFTTGGISNGSIGVYKLYEPIDRVFVKRYFTEANNDGDLYKCAWGNATGMPNLNTTRQDSYGVDTSTNGNRTVSYALKTNKKKSNQQMMKSFLNWINASGTNDITANLSSYMNEDYFLTFAAIQYLSGDWDNFMFDSNNYFIYFGNDYLAYLLPYDMDRAFGVQYKTENNNSDMSELSPNDKWNYQGGGNRSNLFKFTIDANASFKAKYIAKIKALAEKVLNINEFDNVYNNIYNNYKDAVKPTMDTLRETYCTTINRNDDGNSKNISVEEYFKKKQIIVNKS